MESSALSMPGDRNMELLVSLRFIDKFADSIGIFIYQSFKYRHNDDLDIEGKGPVLNIVEVISYPLFDRGVPS